MFCRNCGKENAEGVSFCIGCGAPLAAPVEQNAAPVEQAPVAAPAAPVSFKLDQKKLGLLAGIVAGVVAFVLVLVLIFGGTPNSPEGVAEAYVVASFEYDAEALVDCLSDIMLQERSEELGYKEINEDAIIEKLEESAAAAEMIDYDYEIISVEIDTEWDGAKEAFDELEEEYGKEAADKITEIKRVVVKYSVTALGSINESSMKLYCVKEDGDWKVFDN